MNQIKQFILENWYNLVIIISNIGTYLLTRRITIANNNSESLNHQLQLIYKPLVVYFRYHTFSDIHEIFQFHKYFHEIIIENFEYITDDLLSYESKLSLSLDRYNFEDANNICNNLNKYCLNKFNVICYKLNLPNMSSKGANLLVSRDDRVNIFLNKLLDPWFLLLTLHICFINIVDLIATIFFHFSFSRLVYSNVLNYMFSLIPAIIIFVMLRYRK